MQMAETDNIRASWVHPTDGAITGLSPTLTLRDDADGSLVLNAVAMTEVGSGAYKYNFSTRNPSKTYSGFADGGAAATAAGMGRYVDISLWSPAVDTREEMDANSIFLSNLDVAV